MTEENDKFNVTAAMDQQGAFLKDLAKPLFAFYVSLIQEGFLEDQAMQVVLLYVDKILPDNRGLHKE